LIFSSCNKTVQEIIQYQEKDKKQINKNKDSMQNHWTSLSLIS